SVSDDKWTTVAAPIAPEILQPPSQFAPVDIPEAPPASNPSPGQGWGTVAPIDAPASNGTADPATPGQQTPGPQGSFSPVSFSAAPSASTPNQGWSQPTTPPVASQQWSQPAPGPLPPPMPAGVSGQPPQRRSILPKLIGVALVLILLVGAALVGGVIYVGYKVRQKARAVRENVSRLAHDQNLKDGSPDAKATLQGLLGEL